MDDESSDSESLEVCLTPSCDNALVVSFWQMVTPALAKWTHLEGRTDEEVYFVLKNLVHFCMIFMWNWLNGAGTCTARLMSKGVPPGHSTRTRNRTAYVATKDPLLYPLLTRNLPIFIT